MTIRLYGLIFLATLAGGISTAQAGLLEGVATPEAPRRFFDAKGDAWQAADPLASVPAPEVRHSPTQPRHSTGEQLPVTARPDARAPAAPAPVVAAATPAVFVPVTGFSSAVVVATPEPQSAALLAVAVMAALLARQRVATGLSRPSRA